MKQLNDQPINANEQSITDIQSIKKLAASTESELGLELTLVADYAVKSIDNMEDRELKDQASEYLTDYIVTNDNTYKSISLIKILVLIIDDFSVRMYHQQLSLLKDLKKITAKVKEFKGLTGDDLELIEELHGIMD
jgi:hypothetical protein